MPSRPLLTLVFAVLTLTALALVALNSQATAAPSSRLLIGWQQHSDGLDLAPLHEALGAQVIRVLHGSRMLIVDVPDAETALARYQADPRVAWTEADREDWSVVGTQRAAPDLATRFGLRIAGLDARPNDPQYILQWHHRHIGSGVAWDHGRAHEMTIAIIDTGVQCDHPDLAAACVEGYDYYNDDPDPSDDHMHGTVEGGVAAAVTDNAEGVAGLAWGAKIMPLKAMSGTGMGSTSAIASSIVHAADHGAQVINMSLGSQVPSPAFEKAVQYAASKGAFMAAAGGNGDSRAEHWPAAYPEVVGVGGSKPDDTHPPFNTGPHIEVVAPGWDIHTTDLGSTYNKYHGTSEATPLVAALAALLIEQNPEWSVDQVRQRIIDTSVDLGDEGWDEVFGWGRIDAGKAMDPEHQPETRAPTEVAVPAPIHLPLLSRMHP